jgi:NitT/TauT family transport system substrate-binding protein
MQIRLIENFRAMFYTPFYATAELGAYRAEGLEVEIVTAGSPEQTHRMLAAGGAHVSAIRALGNLEITFK